MNATSSYREMNLFNVVYRSNVTEKRPHFIRARPSIWGSVILTRAINRESSSFVPTLSQFRCFLFNYASLEKAFSQAYMVES